MLHKLRRESWARWWAQVMLPDSCKTVQAITFLSVSTSFLILRIDSAYEGGKCEDCAISEMRCY